MSRQNGKPTGSPKNPELAAFLQQARADAPSSPMAGGRGNHAPGWSQRAVAEAIGTDVRHYRRLERGDTQATDEILQAISQRLSLSNRLRVQLWRLALRRDPAPSYLEQACTRLPAYWRDTLGGIQSTTREIDGHEVLAPLVCAVSVDWDTLVCNEAWAELFEQGEPPDNVFKWMAKDGVAQLPDHDTVWLPLVLLQLRGLLEQFPGHSGLSELRSWCERTPGVREAWAANLTPSFHSSDGSLRPFRHARLGPGTVEFGVLSPNAVEDRDMRISFHRFHKGLTPEEVREAARRGGAVD